ncbi:MAG: hypothetical protein HRF49_07295 [bacterium]|jgi:cytochrome c
MSKTDPGWIFIIIIVAIIAVLWKPVIGPVISKVKNSFGNEEQIAEGKAIFEDTNRWGVKNAGCITCHAPSGPSPDASKLPKSLTFEYVELTNLKFKYRKGAMASDEAIAQQINKCITAGYRLKGGALPTTNPAMQALVAYLYTL